MFPNLWHPPKPVARTVTTTGRRVSFPDILVIRVRDGTIVHVRDYRDGLGVAHAMDRLTVVVMRPERPNLSLCLGPFVCRGGVQAAARVAVPSATSVTNLTDSQAT